MKTDKFKSFDGYEVFDARGLVLGRLASQVAKHLMRGKSVAVVNAEQSVISGDKRTIMERYKRRLTLREKSNPEHSPYWSRRTDLMVKRIIRGMLPYHRKPTGKDAHSRLLVFNGTPDALKDVKPVDVPLKGSKELYTKYVKISELSRLLGYNK